MPKRSPDFIGHSVGWEGPNPPFESVEAALTAAAPLLAKLIRHGETLKKQHQPNPTPAGAPIGESRPK